MTKVKTQPKLEGIQSLRAIAALLVVFCHSEVWQAKYFHDVTLLPTWFVFGESGVDLFFVISGFIIMYVTPRPFLTWQDQGTFLFRRIARIYPAYWMVGVPMILLWWFNPHMINNHYGNKVNVVQSVLLLPQSIPPALTVAWTLTYELYFYLVASLLFYLGGRFRIYTIIAWAVIVVAGNILHLDKLPNPWWQQVFSPMSLEFMGGMFLAASLRHGAFQFHRRSAFILLLLGLWALPLGGISHGAFGPYGDMRLRVLVYGVPAVIIVWVVLQMEAQGGWLWIRKLAPIGDRSYSLYLLHLPVLDISLRVISALAHHYDSAIADLLTYFAVGLLFLPAELLYQRVERPCQEMAKRVAPHTELMRKKKEAERIRLLAEARD
jgi:peptidoglycan/LPS O-acetylase OafA/YrhL